MDSRILLMLAGGAGAVWCVFRWRQAIQMAMVLLVLEGALRKWVFPGAQDLVYFGKDVLFLGAYIGFLRDRAQLRYRPQPLPALHLALVLGAVFGLFQIFNANLPNLLVGVFGFKAYFFYVPLLFILPAAFPSDQDFALFLRRYAYLSIPVGLLAVAQFLSPSSSRLNTYARAADEGMAYVSTFGSSTFVRVTATFSYITGYSSYLLAMAILILALLAAVRWRFKGNLLVYAALSMTLFGMVMTGSRGPVLILVVLFPVYWWLAVFRGGQGGTTFGRLVLGLGLVAVFLGYVGSEAIEAFQGRAISGASDVRNRLLIPFLSPAMILPHAGLFGYGIGATHQTAAAVAPGVIPYSWLRGLITEAETGRILLELGPIGFVLVYFVRLYLIGYALRQALRMRHPFHRGVATASLLFFLAQLLGSVVFDVTVDVYYWFFAGVLLLAVRLDRVATAKAQAARAVAVPRAQPPPAAPLPPPVPARPYSLL